MNPLAIAGSVISGVTGWLNKRQEIKQEKQAIASAVDARKDELKKLSLESKLQGISNASEADMEMDKGTEDRIAWADDVSFAIFLMPAVFAFYPPALPHIIAGFEALKTMPEWYQYALGMMLISVWGYRRLVSPIILSISKAYLGGKK